MNTNLRDWLSIFERGGPEAVQFRVLLNDVGSEFKRSVAVEAAAEAVDSSATPSVLIGPDGTTPFVVPRGEGCKLIDFTYHYEEAAQGDMVADIKAAKLKLEVGNDKQGWRQLDLFPEFALSKYARRVSNEGMLFGSIPLDRWLRQGDSIRVTLTPLGTGTADFNIYVAVGLRLEPRAIVDAAGLLGNRS